MPSFLKSCGSGKVGRVYHNYQEALLPTSATDGTMDRDGPGSFGPSGKKTRGLYAASFRPCAASFSSLPIPVFRWPECRCHALPFAAVRSPFSPRLGHGRRHPWSGDDTPNPARRHELVSASGHLIIRGTSNDMIEYMDRVLAPQEGRCTDAEKSGSRPGDRYSLCGSTCIPRVPAGCAASSSYNPA